MSMNAVNVDRLIKTKIVCTLGPSSDKKEVLEKMIQAGMDLCRLNFSHGEHSYHEKTFNLIREISAGCDQQVSIIADIQGPKIRVGKVKEPFHLKQGDKIQVTPTEVLGTPELIQIHYKTILKDLDAGDVIFINDGTVKLVVESKDEEKLYCVCEAGGLVSNNKGVNIPSGNISLEVVRPKDVRDLELIARLNPEYVAASFIGTAEDVRSVRSYLQKFGNNQIKIIAKIERPVALKNIDEIVQEADAIMVARGDLGVEIDTWDVPEAQKMMCRKANAAGKPVIVATQMLESMIENARPTRAEASDVYNAVLDGADAVMLSGETSVGKYPVETVKVMDNIIATAERRMPARNASDYDSNNLGMTESMMHGMYTLVEMFHKLNYTGKAIVITNPPSGYTARMLSKYRPNIDMIAISNDLRTARELNLVWGIRTVLKEDLVGEFEDRNVQAIKSCLEMKLLSPTDHVIVVARSQKGKHTGTTSAIYSIKKLLEGNL